MKALFVGVSSRCPHRVPLELGSKGCGMCDWEDLISIMNPPFAVKCIDTRGTPLKEDVTYTVKVIIIKGRAERGIKEVPGFLLATKDGCSVETYSIHRFSLVRS